MEDKTLQEIWPQCFGAQTYKAVFSDPVGKDCPYQKIVLNRLKDGFQAEQYTQKQVFHKNLTVQQAVAMGLELLSGVYRQLNAWDESYEYNLRISKSGRVLYRRKARAAQAPAPKTAHNREKRYLLEQGTVIPPLVDMGIFTSQGKVVESMYDKYRQINRFVELLSDELDRLDLTKPLTILDFGCGKSYLTFIMYYYLVEVRGLKVNMVGLDLKKEVIAHCNEAASKYGYRDLHFELGDINGYRCDSPVDIVVTLHACDLATDYALCNAVHWNARLILSVPCCQHELNGQMQSEELSILTRYGIVQERTAALMTDAIRANLLTYCGYKTQLLEFVDLSHTPKNLLIRAVKTKIPLSAKRHALEEVERLMKAFSFSPTLYRLLVAKQGEAGEEGCACAGTENG